MPCCLLACWALRRRCRRLSDLGKDLGSASAAAVPEIDVEMVRKAVAHFPRGSAPGPSGLRPQHLSDAIKTTVGDRCIEQIASLAQLLARGEAP